MRPLRFRAWNPETKQYDPCWYPLPGDIGPNGELEVIGFCDNSGNEQLIEDGAAIEPWTGLKDADGQDIYVGDIVEWWIFLFNLDSPEDRKQIRIRDTVVFSNGVFRLATRGEILAHKLNPLCELRRIGNTHDNLELLEGSHAD